MARNALKYLSSYSDKIENLRALGVVDPAKILLMTKPGHNGKREGIFKIPTDETGALVDFKFRYPQKVAYEIYKEERRSGRPIRLWFLKSRRVGLTSLFAAIETINSWSMDNRRVGIIAHNDERAKRILQLCKGYYKRLPAFMQLPLSKDATAGLKYAQHDSELVIGVCRQPEKVRGDGLHEAHLSEAAYYGNNFSKVLTEISTTVAPAAGTSIILESTGRARGSAAHQHWQEAVEHKNIYRACFLPWIEDPTCAIRFESDKERDRRLAEMQAVEPRLVEKLNYWRQKQKAENKLEITAEMYNWAYTMYVYRCDQKFAYFCRDFPFDAEEAWTAEGDSYFGENEIQKAKPDPNFQLFGFKGRFINSTFNAFTELEVLKEVGDFESTPHIKLWAGPVEGREYIISSDASWGGANSTFTAGYIIDKETREMMAAYHGRMRPDENAFVMASLGHIYNDALLAPEINPGGGGMTILTDLQRLGYYNIYTWRKRDRPIGLTLMNSSGWVTNTWSRPLALGELYRLFHDCMNDRFADPGMFKDKSLITEMRSFSINPETGRPEAFADSFDDRIMALAIAHRVAGDETIGGGQDKWMIYNDSQVDHPLTKLAEELIARDESPDAANVVGMLSHQAFDLEDGRVVFQEEEVY